MKVVRPRLPRALQALISHVPRELATDGEEPIHFTSTQAMWAAVLRAAQLPGDGEALDSVDFGAGLRTYHGSRSDADGLMPVAPHDPTALARREWPGRGVLILFLWCTGGRRLPGRAAMGEHGVCRVGPHRTLRLFGMRLSIRARG